MADNTHIEWTDATLLEGIGAPCHEQARVVKGKALDQEITRCPARCRQPNPKVSAALAAVAGTAGRNDVVGFGQATLHDRDDVIPCRRCRAAIGATAPKLLQDHFGRVIRDRLKRALSSQRSLLPAKPESRIDPISPAHFRIGARLAHSRMDLVDRKPAVTAITPRQPNRAPRTPFPDRRPGFRSPLSSAFRAHVAATVEPGCVAVEFGKRPQTPAFGARLLAFGTTRNEFVIGRSSILGAMRHD